MSDYIVKILILISVLSFIAYIIKIGENKITKKKQFKIEPFYEEWGQFCDID